MPRHAIALFVLLLAVSGFLVFKRDDPTRTAIVFGDSLLFATDADHTAADRRQELADAFADVGYEATLAGYEDQTIPDAFANVWPDVAEMNRVEVLVIAIGTNDAHVVDGKPRVPLGRSEESLRWWLYQTSESVPCVVLVEINENAKAWGLDQTGPTFNEMLRVAATVHPNAFTVRWAPSSDDPYVDEAGRRRYRQVIAESLSGC
jgi:hypothetical protein